MKAVGIVAEYNPFHGGHQYQIRKIRESCGADTPVVAVMSGDFVQRGEAASYDKFTRAEAAVRGGVSLVIELPLPWSLSSAEGFARGGVGLLGATGVVGALSFGSESGNLSAIEKTAAVLDTPEYNEALKAMLAGGTPFAAARAGAARALLGNTAAVLNTPNDLLAVEYLRASAKLGYTFKYIPVRREGSVHDGAGSVDGVAHAIGTRDGAAAAVAGHDTAVHLRPALARESRTATCVELGGVLHHMHAGNNGIEGAAACVEHRHGGVEGTLDICGGLLLALGREGVTATAGTTVDDDDRLAGSAFSGINDRSLSHLSDLSCDMGNGQWAKTAPRALPAWV